MSRQLSLPVANQVNFTCGSEFKVLYSCLFKVHGVSADRPGDFASFFYDLISSSSQGGWSG